jgi:beta-N-acetylhexosaminidase
MTQSAFIIGCECIVLTSDEKDFFQDADPWGFIMFGRNIDTAEQVAALVSSFRECVGRDDAPVLIDQEGGRVQRLKPPEWSSYPSAARFGEIEHRFPGQGCEAAYLGARLIALDLFSLGITIDCLPVLDVPVADTTRAIGDRAYGENAVDVSRLGKAAADGLISGGVSPVVKHMPGHGRAVVDSHLELPRVSATFAELVSHDFSAFKPFADFPLGMTGHVVFEAVDPDNPATLSGEVISSVIRQEIGFQGLLMTDDISMGALQCDMSERASRAIRAGCDVILHCNGVMEEMTCVAANVPILDGKAKQRATEAIRLRTAPDEIDEAEMRKRFSSILAQVGWEA